MVHTARTMALSEDWQAVLDDAGNLVLKEGRAAIAQNVANECRLFIRDAYLAQDRGIPHFTVDLGDRPTRTVITTYLRDAARRVNGVLQIKNVELTEFDLENRNIHGEIIFTTEEGENATDF